MRRTRREHHGVLRVDGRVYQHHQILAVLLCLSLHPLYLRTRCEPRQRTVGQAQVATDKRVAGHTQVGGLSGGVPVTHLPTAAAVSSAGKNAQRSWAPYAVPGGRPPTRAPRPPRTTRTSACPRILQGTSTGCQPPSEPRGACHRRGTVQGGQEGQEMEWRRAHVMSPSGDSDTQPLACGSAVKYANSTAAPQQCRIGAWFRAIFVALIISQSSLTRLPRCHQLWPRLASHHALPPTAARGGEGGALPATYVAREGRAAVPFRALVWCQWSSCPAPRPSQLAPVAQHCA